MVKDIQEYFAAWNNFASNPDEGAQKVNLINKASVLTGSINRSSKMLYDMHTQIDETNKDKYKRDKLTWQANSKYQQANSKS